MDSLCAGKPGKRIAGRVVAAVRRIGMGLQEGKECPEVKSVGKPGIRVQGQDLIQVFLKRDLPGSDNAEPEIPVPPENIFPLFQKLMGNTINFPYLFQGHIFDESLFQNLEDEWQGILPVRDDEIREDAMGMPAST